MPNPFCHQVAQAIACAYVIGKDCNAADTGR